MKKTRFSSQFKKDVKIAKRRGKNLSKLYQVMKLLENEEVLERKYRAHALIGNYKGYLECYLEADWLLIYRIHGDTVYFTRTGTHADLFQKY